jgi:L-histidine Nalpha-methyltransferase
MRTIMTPSTTASSSFAEDVRHHLQLTPRQLPSWYLYDALGSALFDAICELPWYRITLAETRLLARHREDIFKSVPGLTRIIELGPGDGRKLRTFVDGTSEPLIAHLVDVSPLALARAAHALSEALHVEVATHKASFEDGLAEAAAMRGESEDRTLVLFLGSNLGNFDPPASAALLDRIHESLAPGDALLLGADLVKPEQDFLFAYDDPLGVSSAFNLNILLRINQELGGNFNLRAFRHRAVWNPACSRMEMSVVTTKPQHVRIESIDLELNLDEGEAIWTESSYKYTPQGLIEQLDHAGFTPVAQWLDREDKFALTLTRAV